MINELKRTLFGEQSATNRTSPPTKSLATQAKSPESDQNKPSNGVPVQLPPREELQKLVFNTIETVDGGFTFLAHKHYKNLTKNKKDKLDVQVRSEVKKQIQSLGINNVDINDKDNIDSIFEKLNQTYEDAKDSNDKTNIYTVIEAARKTLKEEYKASAKNGVKKLVGEVLDGQLNIDDLGNKVSGLFTNTFSTTNSCITRQLVGNFYDKLDDATKKNEIQGALQGVIQAQASENTHDFKGEYDDQLKEYLNLHLDIKNKENILKKLEGHQEQLTASLTYKKDQLEKYLQEGKQDNDNFILNARNEVINDIKQELQTKEAAKKNIKEKIASLQAKFTESQEKLNNAQHNKDLNLADIVQGVLDDFTIDDDDHTYSDIKDDLKEKIRGAIADKIKDKSDDEVNELAKQFTNPVLETMDNALLPHFHENIQDSVGGYVARILKNSDLQEALGETAKNAGASATAGAREELEKPETQKTINETAENAGSSFAKGVRNDLFSRENISLGALGVGAISMIATVTFRPLIVGATVAAGVYFGLDKLVNDRSGLIEFAKSQWDNLFGNKTPPAEAA